MARDDVLGVAHRDRLDLARRSKHPGEVVDRTVGRHVDDEECRGGSAVRLAFLLLIALKVKMAERRVGGVARAHWEDVEAAHHRERAFHRRRHCGRAGFLNTTE